MVRVQKPFYKLKRFWFHSSFYSTRWILDVELNEFNQYFRASVHFPLTSPVEKSQQYQNKFSGMPRIEPGAAGVRSKNATSVLCSHSFVSFFVLVFGRKKRNNFYSVSVKPGSSSSSYLDWETWESLRQDLGPIQWRHEQNMTDFYSSEITLTLISLNWTRKTSIKLLCKSQKDSCGINSRHC